MSALTYPLSWPEGWRRTRKDSLARSRFGRRSYDQGYVVTEGVTLADGLARVRSEMGHVGDEGSIVITSNLRLRQDGELRVKQAEPEDTGVAVYWSDAQGNQRCMAIDRYDTVAGNLAALAATIHAMRAIERHGGAEILDRAFTGFVALPGPDTARRWHVVFDCEESATSETVRGIYRRLRGERHPDRGGSEAAFAELQAAWAGFCAEREVKSA